jgi:NTE family protein
VLKERFPDTEERQPEILARHFTEGGQSDLAIAYLHKAGERSLQRSANAEASSHVRAAIGLIASLPADPARNRKELDLHMALGSATRAIRGHASDETLRVYSRARELLDDSIPVKEQMAVLYGLWSVDVVRAEREDAGLGRSEAMTVGRWVKLGRVGALCLAVAWLTSGCQIPQQVVNQPLQNDATGQPIYKPGYALLPMLKDPKGEILFVAAFSGGGKRSAAFAHGVLRGMRNIPVVEDSGARRLLDELDYIAAVSGGSFPAMHYGLYRERSFDTFPADFLNRDIEAYIYGTYLLPWNTAKLIATEYGTNDRMAEIYDELMFHGATYADLERQGLPLIAVNATDIALGIPFSFTQTYFDLLCSDLGSFPVARAVAASNGFPVLFSPITLTSHTQDCRGVRPPTAIPATWADDPNELSRRAVLARTTNRYLDANSTQYVHLMDGGIADNLALRSAINGMIGLDEKNETFRRVARQARRVLILSVDGQAATDPKLSRQRNVTGLGQIFSAVSGTQIDAYNFETLKLADDELSSFVESLKKARCAQARMIDGHDCADVRGELVHLSLASIRDPQVRARLQAVPTGLTIPAEDVALLVSAGERAVQQDPRIRALIAGLDQSGGRVVAGLRRRPPGR